MKNIRDKILAFMRDSSYAPMTSEDNHVFNMIYSKYA